MENNSATMRFSITMLAAPFFMLLAFIMMLGVRRGEAATQPETLETSATSPINYPLE